MNHYLRRSSATVLSLVFLALGLAHAQASPVGLRFQLQPSPQHLYVGDAVGNAVYAFPLKNGIPSRTADTVLTPGMWLRAISGIAVDPDRYLYLADQFGNAIDVFAPGASGNASPIRQIVTDTRSFGALAIVGHYLIVGGNGEPSVYAKPPDTPGTLCPVCVTQPIEVMQTGSIINTLTTGPDGTVYASVIDGGLYEYFPAYNGVTNFPYPLEPGRIIQIDAQYYGGLAVDGKDIYARDRGDGKGKYILVNVIPVTSTTGKPVRQMETKPCGSILTARTGAFLSSSGYLYVECNTPLGVFIYDNRDQGLVSPLFSLTGPFSSAYFIALGP